MSTFQIAWDCHDPARLVTFWALALGYQAQPPPDGHPTWNDYYGVGPRIWFQQVPEAKQLKNRLHLDVLAGGGRSVPVEEPRARVRAKVEELLSAGATPRYVIDSDYHHSQTLADPEGNEFCVV